MSASAPRGLPPGYRDIHRHVRQAEGQAASRAELAARLGVSTHTLQRILVDGNVPDFRKPHSARQTLSWVRTLTNLARRFEQEPRAWIEAVGIVWDDAVERTVESASARAGGTGVREAAPADPLERIRERARQGSAAPVEAIAVDRAFFGEASGDGARSFLQSCVEAMVGAVDPAWGVRWHVASPSAAVARLADPGGAFHLAAGLFETAQLHASGLDFLQLPGWRVPFRGLWIGRSGAPPTWQDLSGGGPDSVRFLVRKGDPAESIVRRHWGAAAGRVLVRDRTGADAMAHEMLEELRSRADGAVVLVADAPTVDRVMDVAESVDGFRREWVAARVVPPEGATPSYPMTIAVRAGATRWRELLAHAWNEDLMGSLRAETAEVYASLLASGARRIASAPDTVPAGPGSVTVSPLGPGHGEFERIVVRRLVRALAEAASPGRDPAAAWDRAIRIATETVPPEWRAHFGVAFVARRDAIREAGDPHRPFPLHCESCSTSLLESPGRSECYCRYCSDENGRLLPRDEVRRLIAEWMRGWQTGLGEEESMIRADRFMSTMPAWSSN